MKNRGVRSAVDFAGVFQRDVDAVFEAAWSIVRNREAAADITQQTFVEGWAEFDNTPLEMFDMWLLARARDRAFNWMQVHRPAGFDGDDDVASGGLGAVLRARIVRVLVRENVPVRGEQLPDRVIPVESLAEPDFEDPPPPPDVVHTPPAPQPRVQAQPEMRAVAVEPPGWVKPGRPRPRPRPRPRGKVPAERQEILWQRLTGVGVGALVGLVVIAAVRVNDGSNDPETEPQSALSEPPDEHAGHDMTTTTVAAPPTSAELVVATHPVTTTTVRRSTTTQPPPPPPPPAAPVITSFTGTLGDNGNCGFTPTMEFAYQLVLTWSATGATGGRIRPDNGPWVPLDPGAGRYELCAPAGLTWHLELTGPGGTTSASTTPSGGGGWFIGVTPAPTPGG